MIKFENTDVYGWEAAIRGMRNPMNSWDKSDSSFDINSSGCIGIDDVELMRKLAKAGDDHGKFMRMINVTVDITAPLYFWKEFDTYKVGTVANSCSTMHTIHKQEISKDMFSTDGDYEFEECDRDIINSYMGLLEKLRKNCISGGGQWRRLIQLLPSSFNQRRTVQMNYQVLKHIRKSRKGHKLYEWHDFINWIDTLPLSDVLIALP